MVLSIWYWQRGWRFYSNSNVWRRSNTFNLGIPRMFLPGNISSTCSLHFVLLLDDWWICKVITLYMHSGWTCNCCEFDKLSFIFHQKANNNIIDWFFSYFIIIIDLICILGSAILFHSNIRKKIRCSSGAYIQWTVHLPWRFWRYRTQWNMFELHGLFCKKFPISNDYNSC